MKCGWCLKAGLALSCVLGDQQVRVMYRDGAPVTVKGKDKYVLPPLTQHSYTSHDCKKARHRTTPPLTSLPLDWDERHQADARQLGQTHMRIRSP